MFYDIDYIINGNSTNQFILKIDYRNRNKIVFFHYSGNILTPLGLDAAVRVSLCHYNSLDEIRALLAALKDISDPS